MSNVERANALIAREKDILKEECGTKFRGYDADDDGEICNAQVTDDLQEYVEQVKRNASIFL